MYHVEPQKDSAPIITDVETGQGANLLEDLAKIYLEKHPEGPQFLNRVMHGAILHVEERAGNLVHNPGAIEVFGQLVATLFSTLDDPRTQAVAAALAEITRLVDDEPRETALV